MNSLNNRGKNKRIYTETRACHSFSNWIRWMLLMNIREIYFSFQEGTRMDEKHENNWWIYFFYIYIWHILSSTLALVIFNRNFPFTERREKKDTTVIHGNRNYVSLSKTLVLGLFFLSPYLFYFPNWEAREFNNKINIRRGHNNEGEDIVGGKMLSLFRLERFICYCFCYLVSMVCVCCHLENSFVIFFLILSLMDVTQGNFVGFL